MIEKTTLIESLQGELNHKNIKITELNTTVADQSKNIANQQSAIEQQKSTIKKQDADIHSVWYVVATSRQLKDAKIVTPAGLFQPKKVLEVDFDKSAFTQVDQRNITSIPTNARRVKIISSHPEDSYSLVTGDDKLVTVVISNSTKFWSVSKYLIVQN